MRRSNNFLVIHVSKEVRALCRRCYGQHELVDVDTGRHSMSWVLWVGSVPSLGLHALLTRQQGNVSVLLCQCVQSHASAGGCCCHKHTICVHVMIPIEASDRCRPSIVECWRHV
jgi:hypothetical protein